MNFGRLLASLFGRIDDGGTDDTGYECERCGERYDRLTTPCEKCGGSVMTELD